MSHDWIATREPLAFELHRLDRILFELARPALDADTIDASTRERLAGLGIVIGGALCRSTLIERVWDRKRDLMYRMKSAGAWGPLPPGA